MREDRGRLACSGSGSGSEDVGVRAFSGILGEKQGWFGCWRGRFFLDLSSY